MLKIGVVAYKVKDSFFYKAKREGYVCRSVYKLMEINQRYRIIKEKDRVLDLGAAPGSWLQYTNKIVGKQGFILAIDLNPLNIIQPAQVQFLKADVFDLDIKQIISRKFNVVLSDMAPNTTGRKDVDAYSSFRLSMRALEIANEALCSGGHFVCKVLEGSGFKDLLTTFRMYFRFTKPFKAKSSRPMSKEIYLIGLNKLSEKCKEQKSK